METTPMSYEIIIQGHEYFDHPLRLEWSVLLDGRIPYELGTFNSFLNDEHGIKMLDHGWDGVFSDRFKLVFYSEQDYILWKLHQ